MNIKNQATSDEKLLKIIEGTSGRKPITKFGIKTKVKGIKLPSFNLKFSPQQLTLLNINKGLFIVSGLLSALFIYMTINGARMINAEVVIPPLGASDGVAKFIMRDSERFLGLEEYLDQINRRNMFQKFDIITKEGGVEQEIVDEINNYTLVGIFWSKDPEVMIESASEGRTYLLKIGDIFGEQRFKIKEITRTSIVVEFESNGQITQHEIR
ncbi:MAG: hypothetical protein ABIG56_04710 [Candidatus Omnitrophota bacterium]